MNEEAGTPAARPGNRDQGGHRREPNGRPL